MNDTLCQIRISNRVYYVVEHFGAHSTILYDPATRNLYQYVTPPKDIIPTRWNCLCHENRKFKRPHFTCLVFCRVKRVALSKLPPLIPLDKRTELWVRAARPHSRLKDALLKKCLTFAEWLAN